MEGAINAEPCASYDVQRAHARDPDWAEGSCAPGRPGDGVESRGALHWRGSDEEAAGLARLRVEGKGGRRASGDCSPTLVSAACSTGTPGRRVTSRECSSRPRKWRRRAETSVSLAAVVGRAPFLRVRAGAGFTGRAAGGAAR